jgi:oligopeptide/dipeptide ABC transporter ATP-binding protein
MYQGKIVEVGTADEVFHTPQHEYSKRLLASIPKLAKD